MNCYLPEVHTQIHTPHIKIRNTEINVLKRVLINKITCIFELSIFACIQEVFSSRLIRTYRYFKRDIFTSIPFTSWS